MAIINRRVFSFVAVAVICSLVISIVPFFKKGNTVVAENRYYYKYEETKAKSKTLYFNIAKKKDRNEKIKEVAKYLVGFIPYVGKAFEFIRLCNWMYDMDAPGKVTCTYHFKMKYKYDRLKKQKRKLVDKWEIVKFKLYQYKNKKYKLYNKRSHTLHIYGSGKE